MTRKWQQFGVPALMLVAAVAAGQLVGLISRKTAVPLAIEVGDGVIDGCVSAMLAIGLVLVYRVARVVNFSQAGFGSLAAGLFLMLATAWHWNYWLALLVSVAGAGLLSLVMESLLLRRFSSAPRLVLTVVTIVVGQLLAGLTLALPTLFGYSAQKGSALPAGIPSTPAATPFHGLRVHWSSLPFNGDQMAIVVLAFATLLALGLLLRRSTLGAAIRGVSEDVTRAEQLGIDVRLVSGFVWVTVGVLSALTTILYVTARGASVATTFAAAGSAAGFGSLAALLPALAAAVVGRLEDLKLTVVAAIAIGMFDQAVSASVNDSVLVDAALFAVILGSLLLRRPSRSRLDAASASWIGAEEFRAVPHELTGIDSVLTVTRRLRWLIGLVIVVYPFVMSPGQVALGATYASFAVVAVSLVVLSGWAGQISLGQFAFVAVGAAVGGACTSRAGLPFPVALILAALAAAAVAVLVGLPALRLQGLYLAVTTLALAVVTGTVFVNQHYFGWLLPTNVTRPKFLGINTQSDQRAYYYLCVGIAAVCIYAAVRIRRSRTGRLLLAMRDNERAAQAYGLNLVRTRLTAFAVSGALAGIAGVLYVNQQRAFTPTAYGADMSVQMFLMAVLGGLGSVYACLVGALYLAVVNTVITGTAGQLLASSVGVLLVLLFVPSGLGGLLYRLRDSWLRRVAQRHRLYVPSLAGGALRRGQEALVQLAQRPPDDAPVAIRYRIDSRIGELGASQAAKVWRY